MTTILCTLYNSLYLDKGLVLYDSLCKCAKDFKLYVLCMDDKCYDVLTDLHQDYHVPIRLEEFEKGDEELLKAKLNRTVGEYCWTCSSSLIRYILKHYKEEVCTYIDADMYFYSDPQILVDELLQNNKSAMVVPHRFTKNQEHQAQKVGTYCVEFNTFLNNTEGMKVLEYWRNRCLDCCSNLGDGIHWGDQKYLDELVEKFSSVYVCQNPGAGVAPWNIPLYRMASKKAFDLNLLFKGKDCRLVFYHFANINYLSLDKVKINVFTQWGIQKELVYELYDKYLTEIDYYKKVLSEKFGINGIIKHHPGIIKTDNDQSRLGIIKRLFVNTLSLKLGDYIDELPAILYKANDIRIVHCD